MKQAREASDSEQPERDGRQAPTNPSGAGGPQPLPHLVQNATSLLDNNPFSVSTQLGGGTPNPLLPSPASLQLAQLQAQLTLQRLKLAQTGVTSNTAAASVLNQVLCKVAMAQPLFNPLQNAAMLGTPHGHAGGPQLAPGMPPTRFPTGGMPFPAQNPSVVPRVGVGMGHAGGMQNQTTNTVPMHPFGNVMPQTSGQQAVVMGLNTTGPSPAISGLYDYNKSKAFGSQIYLPDEEQCKQHGFMPSVSHAGSVSGIASEGHFGYAKQDSQPGFQKNCYVSDSTGRLQQAFNLCPFLVSNIQMFINTGVRKERQIQCLSKQQPTSGENTLSFSSQNKPDLTPNSSMWPSTSQQYKIGNDLYNPEEPTTDTKFTPSGPPAFSKLNNSKQGFTSSPVMPNKEQAQNASDLSMRPLQPLELNDLNGIQPVHLPHVCTVCDKRIFNLKDWDLHVKGKMHIQNCMVFFENSTRDRCVPSSPEGMLCLPMDNTAAFNTSSNEDYPSDIGPSYESSAPTRTFPHSSPMFSSVAGAKFPQMKSIPGRVVHICNLPDGNCTENDVINLGMPFGKVTNYIFMKSTNQAFLEMAYTEAAQAMVQFYQEKPATINDEKLLIRMSKRYKELQLKKPGKNVEEIIHNIHSQRERDMFRDADRHRTERTRSRSPVSRSLSPRSHTASFTSCSSSHSPQGTTRVEWSNGREPWDQSPYCRPEEDRDAPSWRDNGEEIRERPDLWKYDRKHYLRQLDKHGHEDRTEGSRGHREKYSRASSPGALHSSSGYKSREDEYYRKEYKSRSDKYQKQMHDAPVKSKRKEEGRFRESKHPHNEDTFKEEASELKSSKAVEISSQKHIDKTKDKKLEPDHEEKEKAEKEKEQDGEERKPAESKIEFVKCDQTAEKISPSPTAEHPKESIETELQSLRKNREQDWESGSEVEGEAWYPTNMEELVTVDEVGEEDFIIEPDILELVEAVPVEPKDSDMCLEACPPAASVPQMEETSSQLNVDNSKSTQGECEETSLRPIIENVIPSHSCSDTVTNEACLNLDAEEKSNEPQDDVSDRISNNHTKAESSDVHLTSEDHCPPSGDPTENNIQHPGKLLDNCQQPGSQEDCSSEVMDLHTESISKEGSHETKDCQEALPQANSEYLGIKSPERTELKSEQAHYLPSWEQEDVFTELSIPLGVEFVVPRTGFYCKLCGLFYTSEEMAKSTHCRSTIHYKNLQKYLTQLAEESLKRNERNNSLTMEDPGIVPQFEKK
ncbi:LOW QUALITY PROTEIN: RNA-binding protein 20 [Rhinatrema bivittatum]|uniref:LOW QUALITY PROTEIN: RNA-binding protein 20 n=1 Tax=Rhinatrema bivittatum TaxID=194408 RepID=UPI0011275796|nr:LOW QUALITY PROTEIN: RNA-binding protein 20 [Rhinatrema bivittatum]